MNYIIIGMGIFGSSLAVKLTRMGHEVIGVDKKMNKVDLLKDTITHTICLDATDQQAAASLPLKDADAVIVAIGEDEGANIMTTAVMKQLKVSRLVSRAVSPLHQTVLEAMGIDEIVHPEEETAERLAKKLNLQGIIDSFELTGDYKIVEARLPERFLGKPLKDIRLRSKYKVLVLNTIKITEEKNIFGVVKKVKHLKDLASADTVIEEGDIAVLYGTMRDIQKVLESD
jgi:trk system potassium uptake protein TrkA